MARCEGVQPHFELCESAGFAYARAVNKILRILLRLSLGLAALVIVALILCLDGVDHRPYFSAPYYVDTNTRLRASLVTNAVIRGELAAGFGRALLTPTINAATDEPTKGQFRSLPLAGYGNRRGKSATGVHDDLYIKAVALRV